MIHIPLWWPRQNIYQDLHSQKAPHISPVRTRYGGSIASNLEKTDRFITAPQCIYGQYKQQRRYTTLRNVITWRRCIMGRDGHEKHHWSYRRITENNNHKSVFVCDDIARTSQPNNVPYLQCTHSTRHSWPLCPINTTTWNQRPSMPISVIQRS